MATGEKTFSTKGVAPTKFEAVIVPANDYVLKLDTSKLEVAKADGPDKIPYVGGVLFEMQDTAQFTAAGEKNVRLYARLFGSLKPAKDGKLAPHRANGLNGLAKALGTEFSCGEEDIRDLEYNDEHDNTVLVRYIDPQVMIDWLKQYDGAELKAHVKKRNDKNYPGNEVEYFIEAEGGSTYEDEPEVKEEDATAKKKASASKSAAKKGKK